MPDSTEPQHSEASPQGLCPVLVRRYDSDSEPQFSPPEPCNEDLVLIVEGWMELQDLSESELANPLDLDSFPALNWKVECKAGHVLVLGLDENGEAMPFRWDMIPGFEGRQP